MISFLFLLIILMMHRSLAAPFKQLVRKPSMHRPIKPGSLNSLKNTFHGMSYKKAMKAAVSSGQIAPLMMQHDAASEADGSQPQQALKKALSLPPSEHKKRMFKYLLGNPTVDFKLSHNLAMRQAVCMGDLELVKGLSYRSDIDYSILLDACHYGHSNLVKYFVEEKSLTPNSAAINLAKTPELRGYLTMHYMMDLLQKCIPSHAVDLLKSSGIIPDINDLNYAAKSENKQIFQFLVNHFPITPDVSTLNAASYTIHGQFALDLLEKTEIEPNQETFRIATEMENEALLFYLRYLYNMQSDQKCLDIAARKGNLNLVKDSVEQDNIIPNDETINQATIGNNKEVLNYLQNVVVETLNNGNQEKVYHLVNKGIDNILQLLEEEDTDDHVLLKMDFLDDNYTGESNHKEFENYNFEDADHSEPVHAKNNPSLEEMDLSDSTDFMEFIYDDPLLKYFFQLK